MIRCRLALSLWLYPSLHLLLNLVFVADVCDFVDDARDFIDDARDFVDDAFTDVILRMA